jgi:hypothetical protein
MMPPEVDYKKHDPSELIRIQMMIIILPRREEVSLEPEPENWKGEGWQLHGAPFGVVVIPILDENII